MIILFVTPLDPVDSRIKLNGTFGGEGIAIREIKRKKNGNTSHHSPYFLKLPKWNGISHLIFQLESPVFLCKWYCTSTTDRLAGVFLFVEF